MIPECCLNHHVALRNEVSIYFLCCLQLVLVMENPTGRRYGEVSLLVSGMEAVRQVVEAHVSVPTTCLLNEPRGKNSGKKISDVVFEYSTEDYRQQIASWLSVEGRADLLPLLHRRRHSLRNHAALKICDEDSLFVCLKVASLLAVKPDYVEREFGATSCKSGKLSDPIDRALPSESSTRE